VLHHLAVEVLWYNRDPGQPPLSSEFENVIVLKVTADPAPASTYKTE
jgi:hypothetical protein